MNRLLILSLTLIASLSATAHAQVESVISPDSESEAEILERRNCRTCHSQHGTTNLSRPEIPWIAGQSKQYLAKQLRDFADGRRQDPVMGPLAATLSESQIQALATLYSEMRGATR